MPHLLDIVNPRIRSNATEFGREFQRNAPFPHVVLDDFLTRDAAQTLLDEFPRFDERRAMSETGLVGRKAVHEDLSQLSPSYRRLDEVVRSQDFLELAGRLTGIPGLLYDPEYFGGGTHENLDGMELDPHVDFNLHPTRGWHRRLNLILYINPEWEEAWGGGIEFHSDPWDREGNQVKTVVPMLNRCVIFETSERSWHGFRRITLPEGKRDISRKSIALYFYTKDRPAEQIVPPHATFYVHRFLPDHLTAGHTLSQEDVLALRALLTRRDGWIRFLYRREMEFSAQIEGLRAAQNDPLSALRGIAKDVRDRLRRFDPRGWIAAARRR
jgi:hypothetical protein